MVTTLFPRGVVKPSKIRCGYASLTVPRWLFGMSCLRTTLWRENWTVGPWGKWETVSEVGTPLCSCRTSRSVMPARCEPSTRCGRTALPLLRRTESGKSRRSSLENWASRLDGERDVVMSNFGSIIPAPAEYSSSSSSPPPPPPLASRVLADWELSLALDSSNLKSARRRMSFAMSFGRG